MPQQRVNRLGHSRGARGPAGQKLMRKVQRAIGRGPTDPLAEKTVELSVCSQLAQLYRRPVVWFGLTQNEELHVGLDAWASLGGRLLLLQFKASHEPGPGTSRRFWLQHHQMTALVRTFHSHQNSVFYVFPMTTTADELLKTRGDILSNTWLLDVSTLPRNIAPPMTVRGLPRKRKNDYHYADVLPPTVTIHSEVFDRKLISARDSLGSVRNDGLLYTESLAESLARERGVFDARAVGALLLD